MIYTLKLEGWTLTFVQACALNLESHEKFSEDLYAALKTVEKSDLGTQGSNIRVYKRSTECRGLIKASSEMVVDIMWLFSRHPLLLGVFDDAANLFIYEVTDNGKDLITQIWLTVRRSTLPVEKHDYYRLMCCPYVSDKGKSNIEEYLSGLVAVSHGNDVDVIFTHELKRQFGASVEFSELNRGCCVIHEDSPVTYVTLSPDSTALAVATESGEVKFYILENIQEIVCVQNWTPHEGKFVTCIMFLDAPVDAPPNIQFWKFALTAGDKNRELKLWSCETWQCLGTLR
ncbi:unnamed protein product [Soboliphyme baturini]|uniref:Ge1_WD40 domain-containing protein n=1 Tax=Soboliphyme baturini TaxID=241478 RepID=A0A183INK7_9BILA|nr:unnamed protein product [Soboliphyme baturini]